MHNFSLLKSGGGEGQLTGLFRRIAQKAVRDDL